MRVKKMKGCLVVIVIAFIFIPIFWSMFSDFINEYGLFLGAIVFFAMLGVLISSKK